MFWVCISRRDDSRSLQGRTWGVRCAKAPKPSTHHPPTPPSPPPRNLRHETEGSSGGSSDTMEKPKPRRNPWPCHVETSSEANALDRATLKLHKKIRNQYQNTRNAPSGHPNIEPSDLSLSESGRLRSKVRCFGSASPGGTIAEASKVSLGVCAVLKLRKSSTPHLQRRHPLPQGICGTKWKARLGDCQIQWKW